MKGTRVLTTSMFYSTLPDFIKKFKDHLPENPKIEDIQEHWMNSSLLIAQLPKIMISVDVSSQMTPALLQALTTDGLFFVQLNMLISTTN